MLATPPRERKGAGALQDVSNELHPKQGLSPSNPWKGDLPSHIKRKQLKNMNRRLRFQPYPSPEPSSSALATSSPGPYSKHTFVNPFVQPTQPKPVYVESKQVILLGRKTPTMATMAKYGASDYYVLPIQNKNISRVHAILSESRIDVIGQNGVTVNGENVEAGQSRDLSTLTTAAVFLDFYGDFSLEFRLPTFAESSPQPREYKPLPSPLDVSSSPNLAARQLDFKLEDNDEELSLEEPASVQEPHVETDLNSEPPTFELDAELEEELSEVSDSENMHPEEEESTQEAPLSEELVGLLAQTLVFYGKTTVPTSDVLSSLCDQRHDVNEVMDALRRGPFGVIEDSKLKDASGRQLQASWFYDPEQDQDAGRRDALAPFMKRVRKSQMSAKRYVWAKPTLKPRRYY